MRYKIDREKVRALSATEKSDFAKDWFGHFYADPVQEMPWIDGEYHFPYGGPYDASEEIYGNFEGLISEDEIAAIVDDLEAEGTHEWAPSGGHPSQIRVRDDFLTEQHEWLLETSIHYDSSDALAELDQFLREQENSAEGSLRLRMAFIQCWSVLEAYLANTLTKHAQQNKKIFEKLSNGLEAVRDQSFTAGALAKDPDAPSKMLVTHLQRALFHEPKRIRRYVEIAFEKFEALGIDIKPEMAVFAKMQSARHDCVHRNGKSIDGKLSTLTHVDVRRTLDAVKSYVDKVERLIDEPTPIEDLL